MYVFLVAAVPLSYVYLLTLREELTEPTTFTTIPAVKGVAVSLLVVAVQLVVSRVGVRPASGSGIFWYPALNDFWMPTAVSFGLFFLLTRDLDSYSPRERALSLGSLLAGVFTALGFADLLFGPAYPGVNGLFLVPALRVVIVLSVPILFSLSSNETLLIRSLLLTAILVIPFLPGFVALLDGLNYTVAALLSTALLFAGGWVASLIGAGLSGSGP